MSNDTTKTVLNATTDWVLWFDQLKTKAKAYKLWAAIDPSIATRQTHETLEKYLEEPIKPSPSDHPRVITRPAGSTRSATVTPTASELGTLLPHTDNDTPRAHGMEDLSPSDLALYRARRAEYNEELRAQEKRLQRYCDLQEWIRQTVSIDLKLHCCTSDKEVDQWIKALEARVGIRPFERRNNAQVAYDAVLTAPTRKPLNNRRDVEDWITKWERALHEASASGLPQAQTSSLWFTPFTTAFARSYISSWVYVYHETHVREAERDALTPGSVLADVRRFLQTADDAEPIRKAARGAFGPTNLGNNASQEERGNNNRARGGRGRGRGGRWQSQPPRDFSVPTEASTSSSSPMTSREASVHAKRERSSTSATEIPFAKRTNGCQLCLGPWHQIDECFYALPHLRRDGKPLNRTTQALIDERVRNDPELAERLRQVRQAANLPN
ncbi:hypothetical protein CH35J_002020 [Colletotrichum higginsianum]|uniref:Gag protein n=1 Tax=Colletotrichum higginsianum TaxID=80884 RepID=A0A4T0VN28_9PEZI|nr:hypothetical protein CH35J_012474 [Colletotrichum higginsianum]TIC91632.1 hypothetical protein CH35J_010952 [Colletotrichum higginsianum]TIC91639.1 hypothetical protein CH35J_010959 [Colletotrichum higginsianum]TIC93800.1 hypothetical protein CH35J_009839 [Colletotrichum higginsianum]TIC95429.1 hypothetical protein CH35J_007780 [Colletotrichum higginsianum]